jgi:hypothetical protein
MYGHPLIGKLITKIEMQFGASAINAQCNIGIWEYGRESYKKPTVLFGVLDASKVRCC